MTDIEIPAEGIVVDMNDGEIPTKPIPAKRGRKPKYFNEVDRRNAKREQNRQYRDRKREELIALRRLAASDKVNDPIIKDDDVLSEGSLNPSIKATS